MHTFLAIEIPKSVKTNLDKQLTQLKKDQAVLSWVLPDNYHIPLEFFGELVNVDKLKKKIEDAIYDAETFHLFSFGISMTIDRKITLQIDFNRQKKIEELVEKIQSKVNPSAENIKFEPHIVVARHKIPSKQQYLHLKKKLEQMDIDIDFPVNKIYLYQSNPQAQAPGFKTLAEFPLLVEET